MRIVWIDTETGGLDPTSNALLSIGAIAPDGSCFESQITSKLPCTIKALDPAIGDIERDVMQLFSKWIEQHAYNAVVGGSNPNFDVSFLKAVARRCGVKLNLYHHQLDIAAIAMFMVDKGLLSIDSFGLNSVAGALGLRCYTHRAIEDAELARACYEKLLLL